MIQTDERALIQLVDPFPGAMALGNDDVVHITWPEDLQDDNPIAVVGRAFAREVGLVLHRYTRAGLQQQVSDEDDRELVEKARRLAPGSHQEFRRPGVEFEDYIDEPTPKVDHDLGQCRVVIPGVVDARRVEDLAEFVQRHVQGAQ